MKKICLPLIIISSLAFFSCNYGLNQFLKRDYPVTERVTEMKELTLTDSNDIPLDFSSRESFSFLVISDVHFGSEGERTGDYFINTVKGLSAQERPDFCVCLGDIVTHGTEEEYGKYNSLIVEALAGEGIKTYTIVGNHDLFNNGWEKFQKYVYPYSSLFRFQFADFSFYFFDSASGSLGLHQINLLEDALKKDSNYKYVFSHYALYSEDVFYWAYQEIEERNKLISMFAENNVKAYFGGHIHANVKSDFGKFQELNIQEFAEPYSWYLVTVDVKTGNFTYRILNDR